MSDVSTLENRLAAAFDRIGRGLEMWEMKRASAAAAPVDDGELAQLQAALEDEQLANQQLRERVSKLKKRGDAAANDLAAAEARAEAAEQAAARMADAEPVADLGPTVAEQERVLAQLRAAGEALRMNNDALRRANAEGLGDADLINAGLEAQLAQLAAEREADRVEIEGLLQALRPLIEDAASEETADA